MARCPQKRFQEATVDEDKLVETFFLGQVETDALLSPWRTVLEVNGPDMDFKLTVVQM